MPFFFRILTTPLRTINTYYIQVIFLIAATMTEKQRFLFRCDNEDKFFLLWYQIKEYEKGDSRVYTEYFDHSVKFRILYPIKNCFLMKLSVTQRYILILLFQH